MEKTYTERLARFILIVLYIALAYFALTYVGNVVGYVLLAFVVSLIAKPLMLLLRKLTIKGKSLPDSFLAVIAMLVIFLILGIIVTGPVPVIRKVITNISDMGSEANFEYISSYLASFNRSLIDTFGLERDFKIEEFVMTELTSMLDVNVFGNVIGTVATTFASIFATVFTAVFISYYLIKDEGLFSRIIAVLTPDRLTDNADHARKDVEHLLSRYFLGLLVEMIGVGLIDFLGLWVVARLDIESAIGIGFLAGMLNIIPYIGPLIGTVLGLFMGLVVKFCGSVPVGLDLSFWMFALVLLSVFMFAQFIDSFVFQPVIYSKSIKAQPLEIFIVLVAAASIGGIFGLFVAIPVYTVIRVIAIHFYPDNKIVKALTK